MTTHKPLTLSRASIPLILIVAGCACNLFPFVVFLENKAYIGSFFGFVTLALFGRVPGGVALAAIALTALVRGDWLYAAVGLTEALFASFFYRRRRHNAPLFDAIYWFSIGLWASFSGAFLIGRLPFPEAILRAAVFAIYGITSAALASFLFDYLCSALPGFVYSAQRAAMPKIPYRRIVFEHGFVFALVPLLAILTMTSHSRTLGLVEEVNQRLAQLGSTYSVASDDWIAEKESMLDELLNTMSSAELSSPSLAARLESFAISESGVDAVGVFDRSGLVTMAASASSASALGREGAELSRSDAFLTSIATGLPAFSLEREADGRPVLVLASAGRDWGKPGAYCAFEIGSLVRLLSGIASATASEISVVDPRGLVAASSSDDRRALSPYVARDGFVPLAEMGRNPNRPGFYLDSATRFGPGWKATISLSTAPMRGLVVKTGLGMSLFALASVLVVFLFSIVASKMMVQSLERLRETADGFNEKEATVWPASRIEEVASLSRAFARAGDLLYRRYHETLAALAEAEEASYEKEKLLAAVSHDIRGPLGGIVDMAGSLDSPAASPLMRDQARLIEDTGRDLLLLVEELLDRAAINAGKLELRCEPFDLRFLFDSVGRAYAGAARSKGVELALDWDEALPRHVRGDRARLFQVLGNLLGNAVKYTDRGKVGFSAARKSSGDGSVRVLFSVMDTGIGIGPEGLGRIFEPFYRSDSARSELSPSGNGLGLAIVADIVEEMGGSISVSSAESAGSRFEFEVELALFSDRGEAEPVASSPIRILVADDTRISRAAVKRILEEAGHSVAEAEDGAAAVDAALGAAAGATFDLAFLDLSMPRLDGRAAARAIRARFAAERPGEKPPRLVALTASLPDGEAEASLLADFDGFIEKPARPEQLLAAIRGAALDALFVSHNAPRLAATRAATESCTPAAPLVDYDGLLSSYGGSQDFLRTILSVFVEDGRKYVEIITGLLAEADNGALGERGSALMGALHSLVNVMGAGRAQEALAAARASERYLRDSGERCAEAFAASGLQAALAAASAAIEEARAYLGRVPS